MYAFTKQTDKTKLYVAELIADSAEDLNDDTLISAIAPGSTAIILEEGNPSVYMLNTSKEWVKL